MYVDTEARPQGEVREQELDTAGRLLMKAADEMEKRGHCKHGTLDELGRVCLVGALGIAQYGEGYHNSYGILGQKDWTAYNRIRKLLNQDPVYWNNAPKRTGPEVVAAMRRAAWLTD